MTQSIKQQAIRKGVKPATVYNRMARGMNLEQALAPTRTYTRKPAHKPYRGQKADLVKAYKRAHPNASPKEISVACDVTYSYAYKLLNPAGAPRQLELDFNAPLVHVTTSQPDAQPSSSTGPAAARDVAQRWLNIALFVCVLCLLVAVYK